MTCEERRDLLLLHAAGSLDEVERAELERHLDSGCPQCAGALAEARAVLAHVPAELDPVTPPASLRETLLRRAAEEPGAASGPAGGEVVRPRPGIWSPLVAAAAAAVLVFAGTTWFFQQREAELRGRVDDLGATLADQEIELDRLRDEVADSMRLQARYTSPEIDVLDLAGTADAEGAAGRIFWNRDEGRWDVYAAGLVPLEADRTYQLWFVTEDRRKVSAGTFDVGPDGSGRLVGVEIPADLGPIALAAVTDEPAGGSPQPTGTIRLAGEV